MAVKKLFAVLLAVMLLSVSVLAVAEDAQPDLLARIKERGTLIIATEGNWSPWTYHDENDVLTGFDIEIGALIAKGLGVEPQYMETDWASILAGVDTGRFDMTGLPSWRAWTPAALTSPATAWTTPRSGPKSIPSPIPMCTPKSCWP